MIEINTNWQILHGSKCDEYIEDKKKPDFSYDYFVLEYTRGEQNGTETYRIHCTAVER